MSLENSNPKRCLKGKLGRIWIVLNICGFLLLMGMIVQSYFVVRNKKHLECCGGNMCPLGYLTNTEDLLCKKPLKFSSTIKNPCWYDNNQSLKCLPYFIISGMTKCGSTDLYSSVNKHPDFKLPDVGLDVPTRKKEMHFFDRRHFEGAPGDAEYLSFDDYVDCFSTAAKKIEKEEPYSSTLTGEATPGYFWRFNNWKKYPQNKNLEFPKYVIPDLIYSLVPNVKIILIFRDPAERTRSHYFFFRKHGTEQGFINQIDKELNDLTNCLQEKKLNYCIGLNNPQVFNDTKNNCIRPSIYAFFLKEWLRVFPRRQLYFINLKDYAEDKYSELNKLFRFLSLREMSKEEMVEMKIDLLGQKNKGHEVVNQNVNSTLKRHKNGSKTEVAGFRLTGSMRKYRPEIGSHVMVAHADAAYQISRGCD